ncbi:MAG: transposase [Bryobacterales bacterium]|nr:transposase [Bryobacterales bacterium]
MTQCGNSRRDVSVDGEVRRAYLALLAGHAAYCQLQIPSFCLMSEDMHLIVVPARSNSLALSMHDARRSSSRWLNVRLRRYGHTGENRYFPCPLDLHAGRVATHLRNGGRCLSSASGNPVIWTAFGKPPARPARSAAGTS